MDPGLRHGEATVANVWRATTSDYATNIRDLRLRTDPSRGDLVPPKAVYVDLRDALRASTGNSKLLSKLAIGNSALCDDAT
jgi:hypothetical protein